MEIYPLLDLRAPYLGDVGNLRSVRNTKVRYAGLLHSRLAYRVIRGSPTGIGCLYASEGAPSLCGRMSADNDSDRRTVAGIVPLEKLALSG